MTIQPSAAGPSFPSPPFLPPWPQTQSSKGWRERAAERLAIMQAAARAEGKPAPTPYAGNPTNIQRYTLGEYVGAIEGNRITQVTDNPPQTAESPMTMWPRAPTLLGR